MRRLSLTCFAFASLALASCSSAPATTPDDPTAENQSRIIYGTNDTAHTAVVALLGPVSGGYTECSGTIVQVCNGVASVLTAAHCCNQGAPTIVVMANDYNPYANYINSSNPPAPAYAVIASSVKWDQNYNGNSSAPIDDFCMLQFNAPANAPVIPVATGSDGLAVGTSVEYVGFGTTQNNQNNTVRMHATAPVDQSVTANYFQYTEGGGVGGPCEGDSGGPALLPAGAAQSAQKVVGTTSYGDQNCQQYGVSMRVTSQSAASGFIGSYLGTCGSTSTSAASTTSSTSSTTSSSSGGSCAHSICTAGTKLTASCDPCASQVCAQDSFCCTNKWDSMCVGEVTSVCGESCSGSAAATGTTSSTTGTTASTTGTTSSGGTGCGFTTNDPTCDNCLTASCCVQEQACANDSTCVTCVTSQTPPSNCNTNQATIDFANCFNNSCGTQCGAGTGTGGSTTTGTTTTTGAGASGTGTTSTGTGTTGTLMTGTTGTLMTSTTGSGSTGSGAGGTSTTGSTGSFGTGTTGTTGTGTTGTGTTGSLTTGAGTTTGGTTTGAGGAGGSGNENNPGASSGCNVAPAGNDASSLSFAGLLLGASVVFSRRRSRR